MESSTAIQAGPPMPAPLPSQPATETRTKHRSLPWRALDVVASLRVTVVLFALSLILVFYGTWAQVDRGIWDVVHDYFRNKTIVWIPVKVLTFFRLPQEWPINNFRIPYPGGQLLGGALLLNLLAAHMVRFKLTWKRAGILILHAGIILMMLGEFFTGEYAVEGMMLIGEGETVNYVQDIRACELAVADVTDDKRANDDIVAIYEPAIRKRQISHPDLPFDIEVVDFMPNSDLEVRQGDEAPAQATRGQGMRYKAISLPLGNGVDPNQKVDYPSAVVTLRSKNGGEDLGTYLLSAYFNNQADRVRVGDKAYEISLRHKRSYRDYTVHLEKAEHRKHPNLDMARDYSSYIILDDPEHGVHQDKRRIFMNNPLRYRGEAFFQADMRTTATGLITGLQVVRNEVWSIPVWTLPYISCVVVAIGMLWHFGFHLVGFLKAQTRIKR